MQERAAPLWFESQHGDDLVVGVLAYPRQRAAAEGRIASSSNRSRRARRLAVPHATSARSRARHRSSIRGLRFRAIAMPVSSTDRARPVEVLHRSAVDKRRAAAPERRGLTLTGAPLKAVLEQQWQPTGAARPFLRLGLSEGFSYTYDPSAPAGSRITAMRLDGVPVVPSAPYSVTVNSFLASGGDNFTVLASGANRRDTGHVDLQAMVDYLAEKGTASPDPTQRSVHRTVRRGRRRPGGTGAGDGRDRHERVHELAPGRRAHDHGHVQRRRGRAWELGFTAPSRAVRRARHLANRKVDGQRNPSVTISFQLTNVSGVAIPTPRPRGCGQRSAGSS